jgi:hypothetical protein
MLGAPMEDQLTTVGIQVAAGPEADAEEVAGATAQLRLELLDLDVESVEPVRGNAPLPGAKAGELVTLGALAVTVAQSKLIVSIVTAVRAWLTGSQQRSIRLELGGDVLELTGVSSAEQQRLTDEWLRRHAGQ